MSWVKTAKPGVRYREHKERGHRGKPDRFFTIRYRNKILGKYVEETAGWSSEGMTPQQASELRGRLIKNIREGKRPQSLAEMREMEKERIAEEKRQQETEARVNISFGTVAQEYLEWLGANKKSCKASMSRYENHIKPAFGDMPMRSISPLHLERFKRTLQNKGLAAKTIHHCLTTIRTIYRKANTWGRYEGPIPTANIEFPKVNNRRLRFLSHGEAATLLKELAGRSQQTHDQALLAMQCGLRTGEILDMRWGYIDFKQDIIYLPETKAGESQQVFMTPEVKGALLDRIPENPMPNDHVFPGTDGGRQYKISDTFKRTVEDVGLNEGIDTQDRQQRIVFHSLRHTFCSWLAIQGTPLYTIKELARHKTITQTERYAHLVPDHKQDAVKAMAAVFSESKRAPAEIIKFPG